MTSNAFEPSTLEDGIYANRGNSVIACSVVFIVLCTLSLVLRFVSHHVGQRAYSLEDWLMVPAWVLMMSLCTNVICSVTMGMVGRHQAYVRKFEPKAMRAWAQTLFVTELIYGIIMALEKTSILLLYLRLFNIHRWFRFTTYALIISIWMWGISESLVAVLQCQPVAFQWNKEINGKCIDQLDYYRYVRVPNVIHDVVMLALPAPVVWKLRITIRQKVALLCVFLFGALGCVASFISMALFFQLDAFSDNTWASVQLMSWTLAEPGVVFICASLPVFWPLVVLFMPKFTSLHGKSKNMTKQYGHMNSNPRDGDNVTSYSNDDSIPLNQLKSNVAGNEGPNVNRTSTAKLQGDGIHVTKEVSWDESRADSVRIK